jgi:hypothetical protein
VGYPCEAHAPRSASGVRSAGAVTGVGTFKQLTSVNYDIVLLHSCLRCQVTPARQINQYIHHVLLSMRCFCMYASNAFLLEFMAGYSLVGDAHFPRAVVPA